MDTNSPEAWFKNLPVVTRSLLVATFSATCLVSMGMLDPHLIILDWKLVTNKYVIYTFICVLNFTQVPHLAYTVVRYVLRGFLVWIRDAAVFPDQFWIKAGTKPTIL